MADESPQPNVVGSGSLRALSPEFWILVIATGVGAGLAGGLLMLLLHLVQRLAWPYRDGESFLAAIQSSPASRVLIVVVAAGFLAGAARLILSETKSGGHGGELAERIWFDGGRLAPLRTLARAILSIVIVAMGASLGREAAPKQTGALIASLFAQWRRLPESQRRLLAACGAGAGVAAVYNVPLGGAFFALEVLLGSVSLPLAPPALAASLIATAVSWLMLPNEPTYHIHFYPMSWGLIVWAACAGPLLGLAAAAYVRLISFADALRPRGFMALLAPLLVFAALAVAALAFPQLLGNGKDVVQQAYQGRLALPLLVALFVLKQVATSACLGSGAPGGLFTPTLTVGAMFGGALGAVWLLAWPGGPPGVFSIIGSCAFLAAATQGPLSALILVLELTHRLDALIVPASLATAGAVLFARLIESRSIYSGRIHLGRSAAGEKETKDFIALSSAARLVEAHKAALRGKTDGLPVYVIGHEGELAGELTSDRLLDPPRDARPIEIATASDFARAVPAISSSANETDAALAFEATGRDILPVVEGPTRKLIGLRRRSRDVSPKAASAPLGR